MPTKPLLKTIFYFCLICLVISIYILIIFEKTKFLEPVFGFWLSIIMFTMCINGVFYKELVLKGIYYKGFFPVFVGTTMGIIAVFLLLTKVFTK